MLRKRTEDILDMADKTVGEFQSLNDVTGGDVRSGKQRAIWKKYQVFTPIAERLIDLLKERFSKNQR